MAEKAQKFSGLTIGEVEVYPIRPRGGLVAFASCVVNGCLYLGNIAIHTRPDGNGCRLVFPVKTLPNGKQIQCVHPITREAGDCLLKAIIDKFEILSSKSQKNENVKAMLSQSGGYNGSHKRVS